MSTVSSNAKGSARGLSPSISGRLRGALVGLIPLGLLAGTIALTLERYSEILSYETNVTVSGTAWDQ